MGSQDVRKYTSTEDLAATMEELVDGLLESPSLASKVEESLARADKRVRGGTQASMTLESALGVENTEQLLKMASSPSISSVKIEGTSAETAVKAVLYTPAVKNALGTVLYEGIFLFVREADILGRVLERLPGMQLLREEILKAVRAEIDRTAAPLIKEFISQYLTEVLQQLSDFTLAANGNGNGKVANDASMVQARRDATKAILQVPLGSVLPSDEEALRFRSDVVPSVREVWQSAKGMDGAPTIAKVLVPTDGGESKVDDLLQLALQLKPLTNPESHTRKVVEAELARFFRSKEGKDTLATLKQQPAQGIDDEAIDALIDSLASYATSENIAKVGASLEPSRDVLIEEWRSTLQSEEFRKVVQLGGEVLLDFAAVVKEDRRPVSAFLGEGNVDRLLGSAKYIQASASPALEGFIMSQYVRERLASIIYEAIFAFLQSVDLLGNVLNNIPILGPVRQLSLAILKTIIDESAGESIKTFLTEYTTEASKRLAKIVTAEANREAFSEAWANALGELIKAPVGSLLPSEDTMREFVTSLANQEMVAPVANRRSLDLMDEQRDVVYEGVADAAQEVASAIRSSPGARKALVAATQDFVSTEDGKAFLDAAASSSA